MSAEKDGQLLTDEVPDPGSMLPEHLRGLVDGLFACVCVLSPDGKVLDVNRSAIRSAALDPDQVIGKSFDQIDWWSDSVTVAPKLREALELAGDGHSVRFDAKIRTAQGRLLDMDVGLVPIKDREGQVRNIVSSAVDVTERRIVEDRLRESEARFRRMADAAPCLIWMAGTDGQCHFFNETWLDFTGKSVDDEKGDGWTRGVHPEDFDRVMGTYLSSIERREDFRMEFRLERHDGDYRWMLSVGVPLFSAGEFQGYIGTCTDIHDRKEVEDQLHRFFGLTLDMMVILDTEGALQRANPAFLNTVGYNFDELLSIRLPEMIHPDERQELLVQLRDVVERQGVLKFENRFRCKGGEYKWFSWNATARGNELLCSAQDVTDRRLAEEGLRRSLNEKEVLLREVHHRVKNNLQVINSLLTLQAGYTSDDKVAAIMRESQQRIHSMSLVHETLYRSEDLSGIEAMEYVEALVRSLKSAHSRSAARVSVEVACDRVQLGIDQAVPLALILNELLSNSLRHAFPEERTGLVLVRLMRDEDDLTLEVVDNGVGIPKSFSRDEAETLGLRLVEMLSQQLGGRLHLQTGKKQPGTEARLTFPSA